MTWLRRRPRSRAARIELPHPWVWGSIAALLVATSAWIYRRAQEHPRLDSTLLAALVLVAGCYALRRSRFAWLARKPGPIVVVAPTDATKGEAPTLEIMTELRQALERLHLQPPSSMPGDATPVEFLSLLRSATADAKNPVSAVAGVLAAVDVNHAYRVGCMIQQRHEEKACGLAVQVSVLPQGKSSSQTFWESTWRDAAARAASYVGSFVLPRSRLCKRAPWTRWGGLRLDPELFYLYESASDLVQQHRFEEALDTYFNAVRRDPTNAYLRLDIADIQERLGLYLDALATCADVIAISAWEDRRLRRRLAPVLIESAPPSYDRHRRAGRRDRQALLIARYRYAVLLGYSERLARQWEVDDRERELSVSVADQAPTERDLERERLRERLRPWVIPHLDAFLVSLADGPNKPSHDLTYILRRGRLLQEFLSFAALEEVRMLEQDYRAVSGRRFPNMLISQATLRTAVTWSSLRLRWSRALNGRGAIGGKPVLVTRWSRWFPRRPGTPVWSGPWPPPPQEIDSAIGRAYWWRTARWRDYSDNYNAASIFAVGLLPESAAAPERGNPPKGRQQQMRVPPVQGAEAREEYFNAEEAAAGRAVAYLHAAIASTDSPFIASRRDWLLREDPDLVGLRPHDAFARFESQYFPAVARRRPRPPEVLVLQQARHAVQIVQNFAAVMAANWDCVATEESRPDREEHWPEICDCESQAWRLVEDAARNSRHWPSRLALIRLGNKLHDPKVASFSAAFPQYSTDPLATLSIDPRASNKKALRRQARASNVIRVRESQLRDLSTMLHPVTSDVASIAFEDVQGRATAARIRADLWSGLSDWLNSSLHIDENSILYKRTKFAEMLASATADRGMVDVREARSRTV